MITESRAPGAYFRWHDLSPPATVPVRTDIAGFVGIAGRGPIHHPVRIETWNQFVSVFGEPVPQAHLAYAVEGFFANGGNLCWIVRVADPRTVRPAKLDLYDAKRRKTLELTARDPGTGGSDIHVTITRTSRDRFALAIRDRGVLREFWQNLSMSADDDRYVERVINPSDDPDFDKRRDSGTRRIQSRHSSLVTARDLKSFSMIPDSTPTFASPRENITGANLGGGADGLSTLGTEHFSGDGAPVDVQWGLQTLVTVSEIGIVAIPDIMPKEPNTVQHRPPPDPCADTSNPRAGWYRQRIRPLEFPPIFSEQEIERLQRALVAHCETQRYRFAVLDFPPHLRGADADLRALQKWRDQYQTNFAAIYYPWLRVRNPNAPGVRYLVPPSGHVAGAYAGTDLETGVHKPAANEALSAVSDVSLRVDDQTHAFLNDQHINVIRPYPARGIRIAGARTLDQRASEWRFVNVRRLVSMVEKTVERDAQDVVFAPNDPASWLETDRIVRNLLEMLFRRGMLDGATAREAYYVKCDATTNTPEQVDAGRLICQIGLQPPRPAEFIEVRIGKTADSTQFIELGGA